MVLNSKSSKKTDTPLQSKNIYLIKLFVIVIIHRSKWIISMFSWMTFFNRYVRKTFVQVPVQDLVKIDRKI